MARESFVPTAAAGLFLSGAYVSLESGGAEPWLLYTLGGGAALCGAFAAFHFAGKVKDAINNRRLLKPKGIYGRVETLNSHDPEALGLHLCNDDGNGIPLGLIATDKGDGLIKRKIKSLLRSMKSKLMRREAVISLREFANSRNEYRYLKKLLRRFGNPILYYSGDGHILCCAGTGAGKTSSLVKPISVSLGKRHNRIITSKGVDMAVSTLRFLKEELGHEVVCIDPYRLLKGHNIKSDDYNVCDILVELAAKQSPEIIEKAREIALVLIPENLNASGENAIFRKIARQMISAALIHLAVEQESTGHLCCNLAHLNSIFMGGNADLMGLFYDMADNDDFDRVVSKAGKRFISMFQNSPKSAQSFLTEAQCALEIFEPASMIGKSCEQSTFKASDIKNPNKHMSIHIVLPPDKTGIIDAYAGLCLNTLATICIEADSFDPPVSIIADEFENQSSSALPIIERVLKIGRSRGCRLIAFIQDMDSLRARYGDLANMFKTQSAIFLAMDVRDADEAEEYSKRSGQRSIITDSTSTNEDDDQSFCVKEEGVPTLRSDEITRMDKFRALMIKEQNPPLILDLVHYRSVDPWAYQIDDVPGLPFEGHFDIKHKA